MGSKERVIIAFSGRLSSASMEDFARHRAGRLALGLDILAADHTSLRVALSGPAELIDAFEMALSLGPPDCLIRDIRRETTPIAGPGGPRKGPQTGMK